MITDYVYGARERVLKFIRFYSLTQFIYVYGNLTKGDR